MKMSDNKVEFKILDYEVVGSDTVTFKLEDGTLVKIKIDIGRVGVAVNYKNPDGSTHYNINLKPPQIALVPPERKYFIPRSQLSQSMSHFKESSLKPV